MSPINDTPDLSAYYQIHRAIRASAAQLGSALAGLRRPDPNRAAALAQWFDGYAGELHHHHVVEDTIFFPALGERVPSYELHNDTVVADHAELEAMLAELGTVLHRLADAGGWDVDRDRAREIARELQDHLDEHLGLEDDDILPLFARHFTAAEYEELHQRALKSVSTKQLLFTVPWLLSQLRAEERTPLLATAPLPLKLMWHATRRRYARRASYALGAQIEAVPA